jgi:cytochrome c oxidase subunit 2
VTPLTFVQSTLDPAGPQAAHIGQLWWLMLWVTTIVSAVVMGVLTWAVIRGRRNAEHAAAPRTDREAKDRTLDPVVAAAVTTTVMILFGLLVASIWTGRLVQALHAPSAVSIAVTGHQWWWEVEYEDAVPTRRVTTANEIHVPVGRPIAIKVTSRDVIHSFWAPNLDGKRDLVPGYTTAIWIQADRAGTFRGQCAEFCGRQHAHMAFDVIAESEGDFERWRDRERRPADPVADGAAARGQAVFMGRQCVACHAIRGTAAGGLYGPDLTHIASRRTIGAGTLPNTREHMARWIVNSQEAKPGNLMPPNILSDADVQDLVSYLETLR